MDVTNSNAPGATSLPPNAPDILVVDDTPANLQLLSGMLKASGYRVRVVPSGALALQSAAKRTPDLILLDVNMPEMDGYEVCRRVKNDPALAGVPIVFISALSEPLDKVKAFGSGGVDYITKPFQIEEVCARVRTHLENHQLTLALEERARELERKHGALLRSEQLRDNLLHMLVHDMRTPLTGLLASLQFLEEDAGAGLEEESRDDLKNAVIGARRIKLMIDDMLDITRMEAGQLGLERQRAAVGDLFDQALASLAGLTKGRHLRVSVPIGLEFFGDVELLRRVIVNLLGNALKFTPNSGRIALTAVAGESGVRITVADDGPGVDPQYHDKIFEKFGQAEARAQRGVPSSGLGLAFCKLAVEAHGGHIGIDSEPGRGSTFWVELPGAS